MVKCTVNPYTIVCDSNVPSSYASPFGGFNDSLSLALIGLPKASQSSPHKKHKLPWKFVVVAAV